MLKNVSKIFSAGATFDIIPASFLWRLPDNTLLRGRSEPVRSQMQKNYRIV
jgi:hypothetical protein